jgi:hypothetical protein
MRKMLCVYLLIAVVVPPASAQLLPTPAGPPILSEQPPPPPLEGQPPPPQGAPKAGQKPAPTPAVPQPPAPGPPRRRGRDVNIQIELTITDQLGASKPEARVVSMIVADGALGRIRSSAERAVEKLNVDAMPELLEGDRLSVQLTLEYVPPPPDSTSVRRPSALTEMLTVILQSGRPMLISQAADPIADRKTTVEVKATIIK